MRFAIFLVLTVFAFASLEAQSLTGVWRGSFNSGLGMFQQRYKFEVQINQLKNSALRGVTYSYNTTSFYGKAGLKGIFRNSEKSLIIKEDTLLEVRGSAGSTCLMTCYLDYSKVGNVETLQGNFTSIVAGTGAPCGSGIVYLERVETSDFHKEDFLLKKPSRPAQPPATRKPVTPPVAKSQPKKQDTVAIILPPDITRNAPLQDTVVPKKSVPLPPPLKERKNELVKTIITHSPDIKIDVYDNGEIDGDTITLYHNNNAIAYKKGLSRTPITYHVNASKRNNLHEFIMYANNLGNIPPNTALMVVTTGGNRYELSLTSTTEKNAKVVIEYVPEDE